MDGCPNCHRTFDSKRGLRVHHAHVHDEQLPNRTCACCNERFQSDHEKKYCSDECRDESVSFEGEDNPNFEGGKSETECDVCGAPFEFYPSEKEGRFCSDCVENADWQDPPSRDGDDNPQWEGGKTAVSCDVCGRIVRRYPSALDSEVTVCGDYCRGRWLSKRYSGEGHPNWRGGGNEAYGSGWQDVRERALERDGRQCLVCEKTAEEIGRNPDVHHILPVRMFERSDRHTVADAHYLDNLVSLCPSCHRRAEFRHISKDTLKSLIV